MRALQRRRRALAAALGLAASAGVLAPAPAAADEDVGDGFLRPPCTDGTPVSEEQRAANAELVRSFVDQGLGRGDMTAFDRYIAENVWVSTGLKPGAPITSRDEYKQVVASTLGVALSPKDAVLDIKEVLSTTDGRVIVRFVAYADHTGEIHGVAPTGRRLALAETHLMCVKNGRIVENYVGGLNPLQWEAIYADEIGKAVLR